MTVKTRAQLKSENASDLADNTTNQISAADIRGQMDDVVDSALLPEDVPGLDLSQASVTATGDGTKTLAAWTADVVAGGGGGGIVSDTAYDATAWDGVTTVAPSKNAVRDKLVAVDAAISGAVSDAIYDASIWNGVTGIAPSQNAVHDKFASVDAAILAIANPVSDAAYDATAWDNVTTVAASQNALRDKFVAVDAAISSVVSGGAVSDAPYDPALWDGVATTAPSKNAVRDKLVAMEATVGEGEDVSYARFATERRNRGAALPKALVLVLIGQSNNSSLAILTPISGVVSQDAYMPVGGNARTVDGTHHGSFFASTVVHTEGFPGESPLSGVITTLMGGNFSRIYAITVAIGGSTLDELSAQGPRCDLYAGLFRLCDLARADGYNPVVVFSTHQGESDMDALNSGSAYHADGLRYYGMVQRAAAQAMEQPDYVAPIVFHHPITMYSGTDSAVSRDIHNSIRLLAKDIPNAIYGGPSYHYNSLSDRTHQTNNGFRTRGEHVGYLLRRFVCESIREVPLEVLDVTLSGTTAIVLFNHEVIRDTTFDWGQNLDTANQLGGFEWVDNGTLVKITAMTVQGRKVVLTLNSAPVGTIDQQKLRVASQTVPDTSMTGSSNRAGSQMRVNEQGRAAIYSYGDAAYGVHYRWAVPQLCNVRAAP